MMTPDSETQVRVWKFPIERDFFYATARCPRTSNQTLQPLLLASNRISFACLLRTRRASAVFKFDFATACRSRQQDQRRNR